MLYTHIYILILAADMVNQFSHIDVMNEIEKGSAVKDQLGLYFLTLSDIMFNLLIVFHF